MVTFLPKEESTNKSDGVLFINVFLALFNIVFYVTLRYSSCYRQYCCKMQDLLLARQVFGAFKSAQ